MAGPVVRKIARESGGEPFLFLPPGWASVELADGVILFAGSAAVRLDGRDAAAVMRELLPSLAEGRSPAQPSGALDAVAESLRKAGALCAASDSGEVGARKRGRRERLAGVGLDLSGDPGLVRLCADALASQGIGKLSLANLAGDAESGLSVNLAGSGRLHLRARLWPGEIVLGPWPRTGEGGCWRCAALRRQANAPYDIPRQAGEPHRAAGYQAVAAAFLAKEIADSLCADPGADPGAVPGADPLAGRQAALDLGTFKVSRRRVLPVPGCPECGGPQARPDAPEADLDGLVEDLAGLVDDKVGLIHALVLESPESTGVSQPSIATAVTACRPDDACPPTRLPAGWGKGTTPLAAVFSAAGEALERYAASIPDLSRLVRARLDGLPAEEVIDPREFPLFHEAQYRRPDFPYVAFDPEIEHAWLPGRRIWDDGQAWIPALFCYLSMTIRARENFCSGSSNGLASHADPEEAGLRAVMELVERDAFLSAWHCRQGGALVPVDADWDPDLLAILDGVASLGGEPLVLLLDGAGGYPVAVCLAFGNGVSWPGVTLGLGADTCARTAIRQAVLEQGQTGPYLRGRLRAGEAIPREPAEVREMLDHALYYLPKARAGAFAFLRETSEQTRWADLPAGQARSLKACGERLHDSGVRVLLADVTSADLRLTPFRVMRAVSPDLQPISFGHGLDRALTRRIERRAAPLPAQWVSPIW